MLMSMVRMRFRVEVGIHVLPGEDALHTATKTRGRWPKLQPRWPARGPVCSAWEDRYSTMEHTGDVLM